MKKIFLLIIVLLMTVFSILFQGYDVYENDHVIFMPEIMNAQDYSLFENDLLVQFKLINYTYWDELIKITMDLFNINIFYALFILTFLAKLIYFYAIYKIAFYFSKSEHFSVFAMLLFAMDFLVYGTTSSTSDSFLVPRVIGISLGLLFLVLYFNRKYFLSTLSIGCSLLMHPPSALPFLAFFYLDMLLNRFKRWGLGFIPFGFLALLIAKRDSFNLGLFTLIDPVWEAVIRFRSTTNFISTWSVFHFLFLIASIILIIVLMIELKSLFKSYKKRKYFYLLMIIPAVFFVTSFVFVDVLKVHFFTQFGLTRSLLIWKIFVTLFFSYYAYEKIREEPKEFSFNLSMIGVIASFIFIEVLTFVFLPMFLVLWLNKKWKVLSYLTLIGSSGVVVGYIFMTKGVVDPLIIAAYLFTLIVSLLVYYKDQIIFGESSRYIFFSVVIIGGLCLMPSFSIYPDYFDNAPLMEACDWIIENTEKDDVFLTEPFTEHSGAIRLTCHKKIFTTLKEGGKVSPHRENALEWKKRYDLIVEVGKDIDNISKIREEYRLDYIFSDSELDVYYELVFNNSEYYIYLIS